MIHKIIVLLFACMIYLCVLCIQDFISYKNFQKLYESQRYEEILSGTYDQGAREYHNLGNTWYKLYELSGERGNLEASLEEYKKSLLVAEHPDTRYNHDFVEDILSELEALSEQEEKNTEENSSENSEDEQSSEQTEDGDNSQEGSNESSGDESNTVTDERGEQYRITEDSEIQRITPEEQQVLEEQLEILKKEQKRNSQYYLKKPQNQDTQFQSMFESFFGTVDRGGEKDW